MTTSTEMLALLRAHYAGTPSKPIPGYLAAEIQAPDSARRADALWLPLATGVRGQIIGHEIKVSRQDVIVELADPMKAEAWAQYCDRWWLVVPDIALLRDLEIPDSWGIMTPPAKGKRLMTAVRPAPPRKPNRDRVGYATVLTRIFYQGDDQGSKLRSLERQLETSRERERSAQEQARDAARRIRLAGLQDSPHEQQVQARLRRVIDLLVSRGYGDIDHRLDYLGIHALMETTDEDVADVIVDRARAKGALADLTYSIERKVRAFETALEKPETKAVLANLRKLLGEEPKP